MICIIVLLYHILQNVYIFLCGIFCKVLPHYILHRPIPSFHNTLILLVLRRAECKIITCQYSLYLLVVELCTLVRPQATRRCIAAAKQFLECHCNLLTGFGFQRYNPPMLAAYIITLRRYL